MTRNDRPALGRFTARYKALVAERGTNFTRLSKATGYSHAHVAGAAKGRTVPSEKLVVELDAALAAGGELLALWDEADRERTAHRRRTRGVDTGSVGGAPSPQAGLVRPEEADDTDRRQLGGLTVAQTVSLLADRIAKADPTPLNLGQIGAAVQAASEAFASAPRAQLRARLEPEHLAVEALLDRRLSRRVRDELTVYAGLYCCFLSTLAYGTGDDAAALAYVTIGDHHAAECGEPLLAGSVAEARTDLVPAFAAADVAARARQAACHPYLRPFLAAKEARAAAQLGQPERARAALADMEAEIWTGPALPGPDVLDEEAAHAWTAITLTALGEGEAAEGHARSSLRLLAGGGKVFLVSGTYSALADAFLRRRRPDPEQAAAAAEAALRTGPGRLSVDRAERTWQQLASRWGTLPAVRDLGELVTSARKALPAVGGT
jgi:hypothetical protein